MSYKPVSYTPTFLICHVGTNPHDMVTYEENISVDVGEEIKSVLHDTILITSYKGAAVTVISEIQPSTLIREKTRKLDHFCDHLSVGNNLMWYSHGSYLGCINTGHSAAFNHRGIRFDSHIIAMSTKGLRTVTVHETEKDFQLKILDKSSFSCQREYRLSYTKISEPQRIKERSQCVMRWNNDRLLISINEQLFWVSVNLPSSQKVETVKPFPVCAKIPKVDLSIVSIELYRSQGKFEFALNRILIIQYWKMLGRFSGTF